MLKHSKGDKLELTINVQPTVKKPNKLLQIIPIIIIIASVTGALYFSGYFNEDAGTTNIPDNLTPTRNIVGTWKTPLSTEFTIATDALSESIQNVGKENRTVTFVITATNQENIVNVQVTYTYSNRQTLSDAMYIPDVSPMFLTGTISGTQLTLTQTADQGNIDQIGSVGVFTFTTTQMEGTWHDHWKGGYEQNVYTTTNDLKLMKQ
jgi:hypothetical protein